MQERVVALNKLGWLAYLDVYGFSALVVEGDNSGIADALLSIQEKSLAILSQLSGYHFFSDSIFLFSEYNSSEHESSDESLTLIIGCVRELLSNGLQFNLFFRESIAFGEMTIRPNIIVGSPIIRAVNREQSLAYPVVVIPASELRKAPPEIELPLLTIDSKTGIFDGYIVLPSWRTNIREITLENLHRYKTYGPDHVTLAWKRFVDFLSLLANTHQEN